VKNISVAMATYNGEKYLQEQMESILSQTMMPHEIIICDDVSNDSTVTILHRYKTTYPGLIKVFENKERLGFIKNFEKAINLCSGDYIVLSDQDDVWLPGKIETLYQNIGDNLLIHSRYTLIDSAGKEIGASRYYNKLNETFFELIWENTVTGCTAMFHKSILSFFSAFPDYIPHDYWLALVAGYNNALGYTNIPLVKYRRHETNVLNKTQTQRRDGFFTRCFNLKFLLKRRNDVLEHLYKHFSILRQNLPKESLEKYPVFEPFCAFLDIYHYRRKRFSIKAHYKYIKYYKYIYRTDAPSFIGSCLRLLTAFIIY
jgi:glycosyltransferase involved in cell wall biosynthesis